MDIGPADLHNAVYERNVIYAGKMREEASFIKLAFLNCII